MTDQDKLISKKNSYNNSNDNPTIQIHADLKTIIIILFR